MDTVILRAGWDDSIQFKDSVFSGEGRKEMARESIQLCLQHFIPLHVNVPNLGRVHRRLCQSLYFF